MTHLHVAPTPAAHPLLAHPLKWVGSHARLAPLILDAATQAMDGRAPTAIVDPTVGGGGLFIHALNRWQDAPALIADTCEPLARLWLDLSTSTRAAEVEATVAKQAREWDRGDDVAADDIDPAAARRFVRREWHKNLRNTWNGCARFMGKHGAGDFDDVEMNGVHSGEFAALLRGSYNGLCRFAAGGQFNAPCGAHLSDRPGKPLYTPGTFAAIGVDLERRGCEVLHADFRDALMRWAPRLKGALVYIDPPFPGTFTAYSPGCTAPAIADLADACAWASQFGATVIASHPAEGASEWQERLPGAVIRTDLVRRGAMEPNAAMIRRRERNEMLLVLRPGVGAEPARLAA